MRDVIKSQLEKSADVKIKTIDISDSIEKAVEAIIECYKRNGKVILFGNGGSAAQAQHIAAELTNKFNIDRRALAALSLTVDTSALTSIANDRSYDDIFKRQIEALCNKDDIVIAITTSDVSMEEHAHSTNITRGIEAAKKTGAEVVGMLSTKSKKAAKMVDIPICIPSEETSRIQEGHITVMHIICDIVEKRLFE